MRILASADIHGNTRVLQWIAELAGERRAGVIVLAGDLLGEPEGYPTGEEAQRQSARDLLEILEQGRTPVLYVMGNDDLLELEPLTSHCRSLHGRRVTLGGYHFVGYQYSLPFVGGVFEKPEREIAADVATLEPLVDQKTVLVTHSPAYGILDLGVLDRHAGSPSILSLVERRNVLAHVHGHIHRCFGRQGRHSNVASAWKPRAIMLDLAAMEHEVIGAPTGA